MNFIESEEGRKKAVTEAYRILRPGGTVAFSFLCFESRQSALSYRVFFADSAYEEEKFSVTSMA